MKAFLKSIWGKLATPWRQAERIERLLFLTLYFGIGMVLIGVIMSMFKYSAPGTIMGLGSGIVLVLLGYTWQQLVEPIRRRGILEEINEDYVRERAEEKESKLNEVREIERE